MPKFWFGLKLAFLLAMAFLIFLWIFWNPISSSTIEWYFKKKVEKELGDVLQVERVVWDNGVLLFIHPTLVSKAHSSHSNKQNYFQSERIAISYDYSLWDRKINFKLKFIDPIFTMNSKTEMLLKAMLMGKSKKAKYVSLQWQLSIPNGILKDTNHSLPFFLEIASGQHSSGNFSLNFDGDSPEIAKQNLQGHFFSDTPGEQIIELSFHNTPLSKLAKGLGLLNIHLGNLQITSGVTKGSSRIKFSKKQPPQFGGELVFSDVGLADPTLRFKSKISKAVLTFPSPSSDPLQMTPGKFVLQEPSYFSIGKGCQVSSLKGEACLDSEDTIAMHFEGACQYGNQPCLFKLTGKAASVLEPMAWRVSPLQINASLEMPTGEILAVDYADTITKLHFAGTPHYLAQLMPDLIKKGIEKQFGEEQLVIKANLKKQNDFFAVDATIDVTDQKERGGHSMKLGFDLIKNVYTSVEVVEGYTINAGWFIGNDFPITKFLEPFLPSHPFSLGGNINFQGTFDTNALTVNYQAKNVNIENSKWLINASSPEGETVSQNAMAINGKHTFDFLQKKDNGEIFVKGGSVLDKNNHLLFSDINSFISLGDKKIEVKQFEGYCCNLFVSGALGVDLTDPLPGHFTASLAIDTFNGTISNFQQLLSQLSIVNPLTTLPLQGNIYLTKGPHFLDFIFSPEGCDMQAQLSGSLSEGMMDGYSDDFALKEISFDFKYDLKKNSLLCDNLEGSLFFGKPEEAEEYDLTGNYIHFNNLIEQKAEFDVVVVDKGNDELLRLVGSTQNHDVKSKENELLYITVNKDLSHINGTPPNVCELTLNKHLQIKNFHIELTLLLQQMATTLRGFNKTKIWRDLGISEQTWNTLEKNRGICSVDLKYDQSQSDSDLSFAFKGADLIIDSHPIKKFLLTGKKQGNVWSIEQLLIDRVSIAADIIKENQKWVFNFLGLRWDSSCLVGLKGDYFADQKFFSGNIDLLEIDLQALKELPQLKNFVEKCQPRGTFKATGQIQVSQSENSQWQAEASLNTGISSPQLMNLVFEDILQVPCLFNSNEGISFKKLSIPLKSHNKKESISINASSTPLLTGLIAIENAEYHFARKELLIDNCRFNIPTQRLAWVANALHRRFPELIDPSIERIIQNSKPEGELKGCIQLKNSPETESLRLELAQGKYWWLGREHDVSHFAFEKNFNNVKSILKYKIENHPCWLFMKSEDPSLARGQLTLSDHYADLLESSNDSLIVDWIRTPQGFDIQKAVGSFAGLTIDLMKYPQPISSYTEKSFPLMGRVTVALDQAYNIMTEGVRELLDSWKVEKTFNFVGQWQLNRNPKKGLFSFQGNMTGQNIHFNGYEIDLLQADCTYSSDKTELNNLIVQDPAGSLEIASIQSELKPDGRRDLSMGSCQVSEWHPSLMRSVGQPPSSPSPLVVNQLKIEQLQGYIDDPESLAAKGELNFNNHTRRISQNPLIVIPTEIITRIGLDPAILTPVSGALFFDIRGNKIVFNRFKDIYSEGRLSKFNLANTSAPSYMDFDGNLNLKIRMKHYNLLFKLAELFTFNVEGTFKKPVYSIRKQPRRTRSFVKK